MPRKPSSQIQLIGNCSAKVELSRGLWAIIDEEDIPLVAPYKWHVKPSAKTNYALRCDTMKHGKCKSLFMHRLLLGIKDDGVSVDHIDQDGLNNKKSNLRLATPCTQGLNRSTREDCKSGVSGVDFRHGKWQARITVNKKRYSLGYYTNFSDAENVHSTVKAIVADMLENMSIPIAGERREI